MSTASIVLFNCGGAGQHPRSSAIASSSRRRVVHCSLTSSVSGGSLSPARAPNFNNRCSGQIDQRSRGGLRAWVRRRASARSVTHRARATPPDVLERGDVGDVSHDRDASDGGDDFVKHQVRQVSDVLLEKGVNASQDDDEEEGEEEDARDVVVETPSSGLLHDVAGIEAKGSEDKAMLADIIAGVSTACVAIPQSCGYALLAGTGVECAFMAAAAASIPAAILGSSRYMQVGCISLASLLTFGALSNLGLVPGSAAFVMGASTLALYAGVTRVALGFAKLGNLVTSLPKSALDGFIVAAVWLVFCSQTPAMLGAKATGLMSGHFATAAAWLVAHPMAWHPGTVAMAAATFAVALNGSKIHKLFPSALLCCLAGGVAAFCGLDVGATVGAISINLGNMGVPAVLSVPKELATALIAPGVAIGITTYLEGAAVCKRWADEDGEEWDSNKELVAQGVSNLMSAAAGGMPVAGVISRAAFGRTSGSKTKLAHGVTGAVIIAFLIGGGGALLGFLPKAVLGGLVGCGVMPLMKPTATMQPLLNGVKAVTSLSYEAKRDCFLAWATFVLTMTSAPALDMGLFKGCLIALAVHLAERAGLLGGDESGMNGGFGGAQVVPQAR